MHRNTRAARKRHPLPAGSSSPPPVTAAADGAEVAADDLCPVCHLLLHRPVRTTCGHELCRFCMARWADVSAASAMTVVPLEDSAITAAAASAVEARCPMCRTVTTAAPDAGRERQLRARYPGRWAEREREEGGEEDGGGEVQAVTVWLGNTHGAVEDDGDGNSHEWTFFVRVSDEDVVQEVQIDLDSTFQPPSVVRTAPPFEVTRIGWGVFTVEAYVVLKEGFMWLSEDAQDEFDGAEKASLPLEWDLSFDGEGSMGRCLFKIRNNIVLHENEKRDEDSEWEEEN
ncbi:hypothetical protein SLS56_010627 [Neofusicoccum ribis]|uniref:Protein AF-9 homolog n=1 Tax=Neofusicoccum ribis TaxID=45134 RepID=A0ABR3SDX6_9PEZI